MQIIIISRLAIFVKHQFVNKMINNLTQYHWYVSKIILQLQR